MKQLAAQFGITFFTVLAAAFYFSDTAVIILAVCAALAFTALLLIPKTRKTVFIPAMAAAALIACLFNLGYSYYYVYPTVERYSGEERTVTAYLKDEPYHSYGKYYYKLKATEIDGEKSNVDILLKTAEDLGLEADDIIHFTSDIDKTDKQYYQTKGYYLMCDEYRLTYTAEEAERHSLYYYAIQLRGYMRRSFETLLPESDAALCRAVFVGDKYALSLSDRESFRYAGASYFVVVSGMHFAVLAFLLLSLLNRFFNRWITFAVTVLFIFVYAAVTGFQPSVLRSGIMILLTVIGKTIRRETYAPNHLGVAGLILPFIVSPYGAGDIGLILSFYATLAILLWASPIARRICFTDKNGNICYFGFGSFAKRMKAGVHNLFHKEKIKPDVPKKPDVRFLFPKKLFNLFASMLSVGIAANILVFPISVFVFHEFSLVVLLSSLLLYIPIYLILVLSMAVCILFWLGPLRYIAILLSWPLYLLCEYVLAAVRFLAGLPFAYVRVGSAYVYIWLIATLILGAAVIAFRKRYKLLPYAVFLSAFIFLGGWMIDTIADLNTLSLEVYSCSDGLYVGVNDRGKLHLLAMDCKSKPSYEITEKLLYRYGGAQTAFCKNEKELDRFIYYSTDRFAISDYLLYDIENDREKDVDGLTVYGGDSTFILDDDLTLTVSVGSGKPVYYLSADEKDVLIIPKKTVLSDIPDEYRSPDAIVLCEDIDGIGELSCTDLIISASADNAAIISDGARDNCENTYTTSESDVIYDLR